MSAEAKYFRVGLFVFGGIALALACVLVLAGGDLLRRPVVFETYFDESVTGLEIGSPVRFRGVKLGQVSWIGFADDLYGDQVTGERQLELARHVVVLMELTPTGDDPYLDVPDAVRRRRLDKLIADGLRFRLATSGITGTSFIQGDMLDPEQYPVDELDWEPRHVYVPSAPSALAQISSAAERIFARLEDTPVEDLVKDLDKLILTLTERVEQFDARRLTRSAQRALDQLDRTLVTTDRMLEGGKFDLEVALENLRVVSENLRELTDTARSYPSLVILGEPPEPSEAVSR